MYECIYKTCRKWKNVSFCILVSDKSKHDLATYIHLSKWWFKAYTNINSASLWKPKKTSHLPRNICDNCDNIAIVNKEVSGLGMLCNKF